MKFEKIASEIGRLVEEKNLAYGSSFLKSEKILKILYPDGIKPDQYRDMLAITRIVDKLFRIATKKDARRADLMAEINIILFLKN